MDSNHNNLHTEDGSIDFLVINSDDIKAFDKIEDNLYIGSHEMAINLKTLKELKIKRILSVMCEPIPDEQKDKDIIYKFICAEDIDDQDLLSHFPESNQFISDGQKSGQNVFVHCMAGISRSATIVIAFIMNKQKLSFLDAFEFVAKKRNIIDPNIGFVDQLVLYQEMKFTLNANNHKFRQFLVKKHFKKYSSNKYIDCYFEILTNAEKMTPNLAMGQVFNCVKCEQKLFNEINVIKNEDQNGQKECNTVFIEPQKWMKKSFESIEVSQKVEGIVKCFGCGEVVANFNELFQTFICNCGLHEGIDCLKFQMLDKKFKIQIK